MPAYLGTPGRLIPFKAPSAQPIAYEDLDTTETSLEGIRSVQVVRRAPRVWDVSLVLASPEQLESLVALRLGEYGLGPFIWVAPDAQRSNLLAPDVSTCGPAADVGGPVSVGGPLNLPDGRFAGRSLVNSDPAQNMYFGAAVVPVLPGEPVTVSAYLVGAGSKVGVNFNDAAGNYIANAQSTVTGTAGAATRLSVTVPASAVPVNAAACHVYGSASTQGARPAVTWTPDLRPWSAGGGCPKAHVSGLSKIPRVLAGAHSRSDVTLTITELG